MYFIKVYYMISKVISDFSNANWHHDIFKYGIYKYESTTTNN